MSNPNQTVNIQAGANPAFADSSEDLLGAVWPPSDRPDAVAVDGLNRNRQRVEERDYTIKFVKPSIGGNAWDQQRSSSSNSAKFPGSPTDYDSFSKASGVGVAEVATTSSTSASNQASPHKGKKKQDFAEVHRSGADDKASKHRSILANDVLLTSTDQDDATFAFDMSSNDRETLPLLRTGSERERQRSGSASDKERLSGSQRDDRESRKRAKARGRRRTSTECSTESDMGGSPWGNHFADDPAFAAIVKQAEQAIVSSAHQPERIYQGSSGSYFVRDSNGKRIAVFKPKDEEPYGQLNPKFTKWMHKVCCPCCFGRSCLVPNQGYLSEAGAYLVDLHLQLRVVPPTRIVRLASDSFNYDAIAREKLRIKQQLSSRFPELGRHFNRVALPPKVGSFQLFVSDYRDADFWLRRFDSEPRLLDGVTRREFLSQFQRLVVLDFIIRNTDRGNDNWLIRYDVPSRTEDVRSRANAAPQSSISRSRSTDALGDARRNASPLRSVAALGERIRSAAARSNDALNSPSHGDLLRFHSPPRSAEKLNAPTSGGANGSAGGARDTLTTIMSTEYQSGQSSEPERPLSPPKDATDDLGDFDFEYVERVRVRIAAIDNGLAFPFKHPDEVRSYPFAWSWLAIAKEPFLDEVCELVLPKLEQPSVEELCTRLRVLFRTDRGFDAHTCERQLDVLRGQILNLRRALRERYSPAQLVAMPAMLVHTDGTDARQSFRKRNPFFSCW